MTPKRKWTGSILATVGFLLSPLSWWNDAFVNLPLALLLAWLVSALVPAGWREPVFRITAVVGYWATNVVGLLLMYRGARMLIKSEFREAPRHEWVRSLAVSLGYTALIVLLIKLGVLKPLR